MIIPVRCLFFHTKSILHHDLDVFFRLVPHDPKAFVDFTDPESVGNNLFRPDFFFSQ